MKKTVFRATALVICAMFIVFCSTACGSSPEGSYVVKSIDGKPVIEAVKTVADSSEMSVEEFLKQMNVKSAEEIVTLELTADGKFKMNVNLFSEVSEGTWKQDGDKISVTIDDQTVTFTVNGSELSSDMGEQKYVFIKK